MPLDEGPAVDEAIRVLSTMGFTDVERYDGGFIFLYDPLQPERFKLLHDREGRTYWEDIKASFEYDGVDLDEFIRRLTRPSGPSSG